MVRIPRPLARRATLTLAFGVAVTSSLVGLGTLAPASAAVVLTNYGYSNSAWGTEVAGGSLPAGSGATAHIVTSCTRKAGLDKTNEVAGVNIAGLVAVSGIKNRSRTLRTSSGHHSWSQSYLAKVELGGGVAVLKGITTTSHSWVDTAGKYHASSKIGGTLKIGPLEFPLPDPGSLPIPIPGVGLLSIGHSNSTVNAGQAYNQRIAVLIKLSATNSTVKIGRAGSMIVGKVKQGVMGGSAFGSTVTALGGIVTSGKTALLGVPCQGTDGDWLHRNTAGLNVPGVAAIGATNSATMGDRGPGKAAKAVARNTVASVNLGGGQLVIKGISSEARVQRSSTGKVTTKATFGILKLTDPTGTTRELFPGQSLTIPGLGVITAGKVSKSAYKVTVSALYIELLPDTPGETVIKLGNSQASLSPNG